MTCTLMIGSDRRSMSSSGVGIVSLSQVCELMTIAGWLPVAPGLYEDESSRPSGTVLVQALDTFFHMGDHSGDVPGSFTVPDSMVYVRRSLHDRIRFGLYLSGKSCMSSHQDWHAYRQYKCLCWAASMG